MAIAALLVSVIALFVGLYASRVARQVEESGFKAEEQFKADLVTLLSALRSIIVKGAMNAAASTPLSVEKEIDTIRTFQASTSGLALAAWAARQGSIGDSKDPTAGRWRGLSLDLGNLSGATGDDVEQGAASNAKLPNWATAVELTIVETGIGVTDFAPGDHVVALNSAPCGQCFFCSRGQENLPTICSSTTAPTPSSSASQPASSPKTPSTFQTTFRLSMPRSPSRWPAPSTALKIRTPPGDLVAVIGGGPLGLMILHVAALAGHETIALVQHDGQVEAAKQLGAAHVVQTAAFVTQSAKPAPSPLKIGASTSPLKPWAFPRHGRKPSNWCAKAALSTSSAAATNTTSLDTNRIHYSDITLRATFHHTPAICRKALDLIASGRFQASAFITGHAHLYELNRVFEKLMNRTSEIKTAIVP